MPPFTAPTRPVRVSVPTGTPGIHPDAEIDVDGIPTDHICGLTVELYPGELPRVTVALNPDGLELDLHGVIDIPISDALRRTLASLDEDPTIAEELEKRSLEAARQGLGGAPGDTARGFLAALVSMLDEIGA